MHNTQNFTNCSSICNWIECYTQ